MSLRQNALVLAVLIALVAILGAWSGDASLAHAWYFPLGLVLLGLAYEGWTIARANLSLALDSEPRGVLGHASDLRLKLQHHLRRSAEVELAPDAPAVIEVDPTIHTLQVPEEGASAALRIVPRRLGEHAWPSLHARIAGPLGLAWWGRRLATDFKFRVMPENLASAGRASGAAAAGLRARAVLGPGSEVMQLREYRAGDAQHVIDWKASARSSQLISRDFSEDQHLEIVIALDIGRSSALRAGTLDRFGHYANLAARFAEHAVAHDDRVGLVTFADRPIATLAPARGLPAVAKIRRMLTASKLIQGESNPLNAALRIRSLVRHRSLVVLLTDLDDVTVAGQLASAARLLLPKHLPLVAAVSSAEAEQMRYRTAQTWLDPYESLAAQEYCAQLDRNVRALRALGAPALIARPEHLEHAVFEAYEEFRRKRRI
jgi:uncharacterized protein (DUF58 family)